MCKGIPDEGAKEEVVPDLEKSLLDAVKTGKFILSNDSRSHHWGYQMKLDAKLRAEYNALPKKNKENNNFRVEWAAHEVKKMQKSRKKIESYSIEDEDDGSWEPFSIIVKKEGNDLPAVVAAHTTSRSASSVSARRRR